jgi:hypothetical protein
LEASGNINPTCYFTNPVLLRYSDISVQSKAYTGVTSTTGQVESVEVAETRKSCEPGEAQVIGMEIHGLDSRTVVVEELFK